MSKYLDLNGLTYLWNKIDSRKSNKLVAGNNITLTQLSNKTIKLDVSIPSQTLYDSLGQNEDGSINQKVITNELNKKQDKLNSNQLLTLNSNLKAEDKTKLDTIQTGANKNIQPDWNQTNASADDFIKNKPTIPSGSVLYPNTGTNTNGAMTQKATTDELNKKVDKVAGKTLTANDFTNPLKDIVNNSITTLKVNGTNKTATNHLIELTIPTKVSQLNNDSLFLTDSQVETKINNKLTAVMTYKGSVNSFSNLPLTAKIGDVYNVNDTDDNYAFNGTNWDKLSSTINLSNYLLKSDMVAITNNEIDTIVGA